MRRVRASGHLVLRDDLSRQGAPDEEGGRIPGLPGPDRDTRDDGVRPLAARAPAKRQARARGVLLGLAAMLVTGVAAAGCSGRAEAGDGERAVVVTMHHSRFEPREITVEPGSTVRFVLRNTDPIDHELILGDDAVQQWHEKGTDAHHDGPGEVSVPAGEERTTTFTFNWTGSGQLEYACHLPGHYAYGMRGVVHVRPA